MTPRRHAAHRRCFRSQPPRRQQERSPGKHARSDPKDEFRVRSRVALTRRLGSGLLRPAHTYSSSLVSTHVFRRATTSVLVAIVGAMGSPVSGGGGVSVGDAPPSGHLTRITLPNDGLSLAYPSNWYVTTRHLDYVVDPHTLVAVASYVIPPGSTEDCAGTRARGRPPDGVFILIKEVLDGASLKRSLPRLPQRPRQFHLPSSGNAGCLPPNSALFQFRVAHRRAFYVFISIGPRATAHTRRAAQRLLDTMTIAPRR